MSKENVVDDIFGQLGDATAQREAVSLETLMETFGRRAYGPVLFILGVITVSPLGAIPGATLLLASIFILLIVQYALRDQPPWLPDFLKKRTVGADRADGALKKMHPYAKRLEGILSERQVALTAEPWTYLWALVMFALSVSLYPMAIVPGGAAAPGAALALMGLAIAARDGRALVITGILGVLILIATTSAVL